jgi:hypothetical protein
MVVAALLVALVMRLGRGSMLPVSVLQTQRAGAPALVLMLGLVQSLQGLRRVPQRALLQPVPAEAARSPQARERRWTPRRLLLPQVRWQDSAGVSVLVQVWVRV